MRAFAHEQFARLILNYDEVLGLISESFPVECEATVTNAKEENLDPCSSLNESLDHKIVSSPVAEGKLGKHRASLPDSASVVPVNMTLEANLLPPSKLVPLGNPESRNLESDKSKSSDDQNFAVSTMSPSPSHVVQTVTNPISSKLAVVHHVSQAIKSLRWMLTVTNV